MPVRQMNQLSEEQKLRLYAEVADALKEGLTIAQAARKTNCSVSAARTIRRHVFPELPTKQKIDDCSDSRRQEIVEYYRGHRLVETASKFGIRAEAVTRLARIEGFHKSRGRVSPSSELLTALHLRLITISGHHKGSCMYKHFLEHTPTGKRAQVSQTEIYKIRSDARAWLQKHAARVKEALRN